jgi:disulfide oxidoreductase YuzD
MSEKLKTCIECGEEKPLIAFASHPLKMQYSRCGKCFPAANAETTGKALEAATCAKYPGKRYEVVLDIKNGQRHWDKVQTRIIDKLLLKKLAA